MTDTLLDKRCLEHDHHFSEFDLYDDEGNSLPNQIDAACTRCGRTMAQSLGDIAAECRQMIEGRVN